MYKDHIKTADRVAESGNNNKKLRKKRKDDWEAEKQVNDTKFDTEETDYQRIVSTKMDINSWNTQNPDHLKLTQPKWVAWTSKSLREIWRDS